MKRYHPFSWRVLCMLSVLAVLCLHYGTVIATRVQAPTSDAHLQRELVLVFEKLHSGGKRLVSLLWIQVGKDFADVVQIPVQVLIADDTTTPAPTLANLCGSGPCRELAAGVVRYGLGLPVPTVRTCSVEDLAALCAQATRLRVFIPETTTLHTQTGAVSYTRGWRRLSADELIDLWVSYSPSGGEWGRIWRQRQILMAIVSAKQEVSLPEHLSWLTRVRKKRLNFYVVPGSRPVGWKGGESADYVVVDPLKFNLIARELWKKDWRSAIRVELCFGKRVPPAERQRITERVFDTGYWLFLTSAKTAATASEMSVHSLRIMTDVTSMLKDCGREFHVQFSSDVVRIQIN